MSSLRKRKNVFSLGSQVGGPRAADATQEDEQLLRDALNAWTGHYTNAIREFAFLLRVDGEIHTYTKLWNIAGAQAPQRKRDWIEVEIGIPIQWWKGSGGKNYKAHLTAEIEKGLIQMIDLLERNKHPVKGDALLKDRQKIRDRYIRN